MATLVLSAAGAAMTSSFGGSIAGISTLAMGKAAGAILGNTIDQTILGAGSAPVETGKVDQFRVMGASEGTVLPRVFGRTRVAGQLIWSSRFLEAVNEQNVGGKGGGQSVREFSYSINLALALCEGEVVRIGRIWADGQPLDQSDLVVRLHEGTEHQIPDPVISAIEGLDNAPAYRGTAYVVIERLQLAPFGNRIPQLNFEVFRRVDVDEDIAGRSPSKDISGVALVPGTGEYSLATEPVKYSRGKGNDAYVNVHNDLGQPDLVASIEQLESELPNVGAVSLVVSWFGDDLRCAHCSLQPKVEQRLEDGNPIRWQVAGISRGEADQVSLVDGIPLFGGTPADATVIQSIRLLKAKQNRVMFYPFILMDILQDNGLPNPWSDGEQPVVPWRGRITLSKAAGQMGSPDGTSAAQIEVDSFFGTEVPEDFSIEDETVVYSGPEGWSYRRFILHYAHLCAAAGGVDSFCIGSELRGLTQIRDGKDSYPFVDHLRALAADVRQILGPETKIGYAADWSEYFGHHANDGSGDVFFHLDPLWSDPEIDFVGIDNYMPLSDWRDGTTHADAGADSIYSMDYLAGNVAGGEGFDWYYADEDGRKQQHRLPIQDTAHNEHWLFRYKDILGWWAEPHHNRIGGVRQSVPTDWEPRSKPIWFTELGCPAVDKGTNQPNVFHDPKSSESFFPYHSSGARDDYIQYRYLQAMYSYWGNPEHNPLSTAYGGRMVDLSNAYVWAWDARPWPDFPARMDAWADGDNYERGHWLNGRTCNASLAEVVADISGRAGLNDLNLDQLHGVLTGYSVSDIESARQSLQPLLQVYGIDSSSNEGKLSFGNRSGSPIVELDPVQMVHVDSGPDLTLKRSPKAELAGRVVFGYVDGNNDYATGAVDAVNPDESEPHTSRSGFPLVMNSSEAQFVAHRWLAESLVARDEISFALPPSSLSVVPGDTFSLLQDGVRTAYRIDRIDELGHRVVNAVRVETGIYASPPFFSSSKNLSTIDRTGAPHLKFLDIPLLAGTEVPHAPHIAVTSQPWQGNIAVYSSSSDDDNGYSLNTEVTRPSVMGETLDPVPTGRPGEWLNSGFRVKLYGGTLSTKSAVEVLNGANAAAIRHPDHPDWEIIQFRSAELIGPDQYVLSDLLRGQAGTDGVAPESWPEGSDFVLLNGGPRQINLAMSARGLARNYRVGPAGKPYDSFSYRHEYAAFDGVGLRPYRPVHLSAVRQPGGGIHISWIRRTRVDGDNWAGIDVPLGEESELYHVRLLNGLELVAEYSTHHPSFVYSAAEQLSRGIPNPLTIEVAQISESFGPGPYQRTMFDE